MMFGFAKKTEEIVSFICDDSSEDSSDDSSDDDEDSYDYELSDDYDLSDIDDIDDDGSSESSSDMSFEIALSAYDDAKSYHKIWRHLEDTSIKWNKEISLDALQEEECVDDLRWRKKELIELFDALWEHGFHLYLPPGSEKDRVKCYNRYNVSYEVGMIVLLYGFRFLDVFAPIWKDGLVFESRSFPR